MSNKLTGLVLTFLCCAMAFSSGKGPGSGSGGSGKGGGTNSGGGNGSAVSNPASTSSTGANTSNGKQGAGQRGNQVGNPIVSPSGNNRKLGSLKTVAVPGPTTSELNDLVRDKAAAIALGKAFFWEMQFGSDGFTACATCHFNAGAGITPVCPSSGTNW
ncbi:MAG TPA: hypothetical protein VIK39_03580 [Candidatus Angelobacter sp.]